MLTITGLVAVYSASFVIGLADFGDSNHFIVRQAVWAAFGALLLVAAAKTDYRKYRRLAVPIMGATILMLIAVLVVGIDGGGARRWLGQGELSIQPAEFAKLTVIVYLSAWLCGKGDSIRSFEDGLMPFVIIIGLVGALIMLEPNLGTTLIILMITVTMFWVAGASVLQMGALFAAGFVAVALVGDDGRLSRRPPDDVLQRQCRPAGPRLPDAADAHRDGQRRRDRARAGRQPGQVLLHPGKPHRRRFRHHRRGDGLWSRRQRCYSSI